MNIEQLITEIAKKHAGFETLKTANADSEDFRDVAVWCMRAALMEAFEAGVKHAKEQAA